MLEIKSNWITEVDVKGKEKNIFQLIMIKDQKSFNTAIDADALNDGNKVQFLLKVMMDELIYHCFPEMININKCSKIMYEYTNL